MTLIAGDVRPVMRVSEASELISAFVTLDSISGPAAATAFTIGLYRFDASGSTAAASLLALIDGAAATATAWAALRPKPMNLSTSRVLLSPGDSVAMVTASPWTGSLSMRFRRAL